jgi:hypothetical protein
MQNVLSIYIKIFISCLLTFAIIACGGGNSAACSAVLGALAGGSSACSNTDNTNSAGAAATPPNANINAAPVANAGPNQSVLTGSLVVLDGTKSVDANNNVLNFKWVITSKPSGSAATFYSITMARPFFTADLPGLYVASLIVNNGKLDSNPAEVKIVSSLENAAPVANAGTDQTVLIGSVVRLDGTKSTDANNDPLNVYWVFIDKPKGSSAILSSSTNAQPSFSPDIVGSYVLSLVVNDGKINSDPSTTRVTVFPTNQPPVAVPGVMQTVTTAGWIYLDGSNSKTYSNNSLSFSWSLISKPMFSSALFENPNVPKPRFYADFPGQYLANLVVTSGGISSSPVTVLISASNENLPPVAVITGPKQPILLINGGTVVTLDGSQSKDPNNDPLTFSWNLVTPSGSKATLSSTKIAMPSFTADLPGAYIATLMVNDGKLNSQEPAVTNVLVSHTYQLSSPVQEVEGFDCFKPNKNTVDIALKTTDLSSLVPYTLTVNANIISSPETSGNVLVDASGNGSITITNAAHPFPEDLTIKVYNQKLLLKLKPVCKGS